MGIRKKVRTVWKEDRKKNIADRRKKKAKRLSKQTKAK